MKDIIEKQLQNSIAAKQEALASLVPDIEASAEIILDALKNGKKILACGNGGSASQAQHFIAELVVRFETDRRALPGISLTTDTSNLTAAANDFGYDQVFSRQVEALGNEGDVIVGLTTSGNSPNVIKAFEAAQKKGMKIICLNGKSGGKLKDAKLDTNIIVSDENTARVQEVHITIIHIWCKLVDSAF